MSMSKISEAVKFPFFVLAVSLFVSCATFVEFTVDRPPMVDLRNVNSITVIPLEWNKYAAYPSLAASVTEALTDGVKKGNINFIDPSELKNIQEKDYGKYVDVYISGNIYNVRVYDDIVIKEEAYRNKTIKMYNTTRTMYIDIEYTYIRGIDNSVLGNFKKTETASDFFISYRNPNTRSSLRRIRRSSNAFPPRETQLLRMAKSAISKFENTMSYELGPWTTTERRYIKRTSGNDPDAKRAKNFVSRKNYSEALDIYEDLYKQTGSINNGYNTAILLEATSRFLNALILLGELENTILESGKKSPSFIKKEIERVKIIISGNKVLEAY